MTENSKKAFFNTKNCIYIGYIFDPTGHKQVDILNFLNALKSKRDKNFLMIVLVSDVLEKRSHFDFDVLLEENLIFHKVKFYPSHQWFKNEPVEEWDTILKIIFKI